ncbi:MAG TPA: sodium:solute symporter, partial [Pricia sp.]|nr:sodium:solute symporter [Pricia sp.]
MFFKFVKGNAVFFAAILTQLIIFVLFYFLIFQYPEGKEKLSYLWLNFIGAALVTFIAMIIEGFDRLLKNPPVRG